MQKIMEIYRNKYKMTTLDEDRSLIINVWTKETTFMSDKEFIHEITVWTEAIEAYNPRFLLADTKLFGYPLHPIMQAWTNTEVFPRLTNAGVEKFAIIISADLITQLGIEQVMQEDNSSGFASRFFENTKDALLWLT